MVLLHPQQVNQPLLLSSGCGAAAIRVPTTPRVRVLSTAPITNAHSSSAPPPLLSAQPNHHPYRHQPLLRALRATTSSSPTPAALSATLPAAPPPMAGDPASPERVRSSSSTYEEALNCLSSLITTRQRGDGSNRGDQFELMPVYVKMLDMEDRIEKLKVIHVAGTKGKGSTCSFTESILRSCGYRTGLFTSPHLIDVRERFKLDGMEISEDKFLTHFWWCWHRLQEKTKENVQMPTFFRFLALLAFRIFCEEQVDVTILEVGLGGKFDATNVVKRPTVCGVSSLGYDHMEILGNTLHQIAGEKAGIFKEHVPAYTVPQPEEAMLALESRASELGVPLTVVQPIDIALLKGQKLGLDGEHQYVNAGLAVALCRTWLKEAAGNIEGMYLDDSLLLPEQFVRGLSTASLSGRAQIVPDLQYRLKNQESGNLGELIFYLDGAHSPESMEVCARWFSHAIKTDEQKKNTTVDPSDNEYDAKQILLFNCMSVRDPQMLLPRLLNACSANGVYFHKALFVPNQSLYHKVGSHAAPPNDSPTIDLSWQKTLQRVWENLAHGDRGNAGYGLSDSNIMNTAQERDATSSLKCQETSTVFPSLPSAIKWLRDTVQKDRSIRLQVLVTGSLHLVGDVLRLIKK